MVPLQQQQQPQHPLCRESALESGGCPPAQSWSLSEKRKDAAPCTRKRQLAHGWPGRNSSFPATPMTVAPNGRCCIRYSSDEPFLLAKPCLTRLILAPSLLRVFRIACVCVHLGGTAGSHRCYLPADVLLPGPHVQVCSARL